MIADPRGRRVDFRLYLEGIRVPIRSISVAGTTNNHTQANIEIPPTPLSTQLQPRSLVHVIYKTSIDTSFKLLFEGELIGISAAEDTRQKSTTLICAGLTNYWEYVWMYFLNNVSPSAYSGTETAAFVSGVSPEARAQFSGINFAVPQPLVSSIVQSAFVLAEADVQRALLNIVFLMANTGTGVVGDITSPRINSFLEKAFINLRLGERVFVLPDNELKNLINMRLAQALLSKAVGDLGNFSTLTELINRFLNFVFYTWVSPLAPSYTARNSNSSESTLDFYNPLNFKKQTSGDIPKLAATTTSVASENNLDAKNVLRSVLFKPKTYFLPPPTCNFLFPSMFDTFSSTRMFLNEPTRMRVQAHPIPGASGDITAWNIASFYAPKELGEFIRDTERTSGFQPESTQLLGQDLSKSLTPEEARAARSVEQSPQLSTSPTYRYEKLIQQTGSGAIDETITGVVPSFEELGWAEYASLGIDAPVNNRLEVVAQPGSDDISTVEKAREIGRRTSVGSEEIAATSEKYLAALAQYKLGLRRHIPRVLEGVRGPYNPNLVQGFPGIVFTKRAIFVGEVSSLNHIGNSGAQAYTSLTISTARELSMIPGIYRSNDTELDIFEEALRSLALEEVTKGSSPTFDQFRAEVLAAFWAREARAQRTIDTTEKRLESLMAGFDPADRLPDQPEWLNDKYRAKNIGKEVYRKLFGGNVRSLLEISGGSTAAVVSVNMVIAANRFLIQYLRASDKVVFVETLTKRDIATARQAMFDFLGMSAPPREETLDRQGPFVPDDLVARIDATEESSKPLAQETIAAPKSPFHPKRVEAVRNYISHIAGASGKAFRG